MGPSHDDPGFDAIAFGAHPDDVEMGMGGTVAALSAAGRRVGIVVLTSGELGSHGTPETRREEAQKAASILGCDLRILDFRDGGVPTDLPAKHRLVEVLREMRPAMVFTPYPHTRSSHWDGRSNVDHLAAGILVRDACKLARLKTLKPELPPHFVQRLYYYMLPDTITPTYTVDVSAHKATLQASIEAYASQMPIRRGDNDILSILMVLRRAHGIGIHAELGETFLCEDPVGGPAELLFEI